MQRHIFRLVLVAIVLLLLGLSVIPPKEKLRLGKDLSGGVSMIYAVNIRPSDPPDVLSKTIEVLKQRIDPGNQLDITMVAQGRDRIEITMPAPTEEVKALRKVYDDALNGLGATEIDPSDLERAMRSDEQTRAAILTRLAAGDAERQKLLTQTAEAFDNAKALRGAYRQLKDSGTAQGEILQSMVGQVSEAEISYEQLRDSVLALSLNPEEVSRALLLPEKTIRKFDNETGEAVELDSPQKRALDRLREQHPDVASELDRVVETFQAYKAKRRSLDDPEDLKRLLRGSGVLDFRISVDPAPAAMSHPDEDRLRRELQERGPRNVRANDASWYKLNKIDSWYDSVQQLRLVKENPAAFFSSRSYVVEEYDGEYYMLCWDTRGNRLTKAEGNWDVSGAFQSSDEIGRPAIAFTMNAKGGVLLGELTNDHVKDRMAVLLDDQVYTAPVLQSRISRQGRISGEFTQAEIRYIVQVLSAGSLQQKLSPEPISQSTVGPDLGLDNLHAGLKAGIWALGIVSVFMVLYYFQCGIVAVIALVCNAILIMGAMAMNHAAFTLPGIAGIILTFGMAVDANVLIYERIREELELGNDARTAVRLGFSKALSSIVDGNVTNLIVCVVLGYTGTQEIKGFAITLGIGVVATLFSALVIARLIFALSVEDLGWKRISMLPMVIKPLGRLLRPNFDWMKFRYVFLTISICYVMLGVVMVVWQGEKMLDNEFRGGTSVTISFKDDDSGTPMTMTRAAVQDRVREIAAQAEDVSQLKMLSTADVLPVDPESDGITSSKFRIKTVAQDQSAVVGAITSSFSDLLDQEAALEFDAYHGGSVPDFRVSPVYRILTGTLGDDINMPEFRDDVSEYVGGVAIVLDNLHLKDDSQHKRPDLAGLETRLESFRKKAEYSGTLTRAREVRVLRGTKDAVETAVVLVREDGLSFFDDEQAWDQEVAGAEWALTCNAIGNITTLAEVQNFSAAIASTFKARAIVAVILSFFLITIYIWVRFGSVRYSLAAIVALMHDVLVAIGLIAMAEIVYEMEGTQHFAQWIGLMPFKIDLSLVAALLTIVGYSLNDSIIIMDRIRENKGKLAYASRSVVNQSINQTVSRTLVTSGTTFLAVLILYIFGGEGVRAFAFTLMIGVVFGTYSSIAVAAPLVWSTKRDPSVKASDSELAEGSSGAIASS